MFGSQETKSQQSEKIVSNKRAFSVYLKNKEPYAKGLHSSSSSSSEPNILFPLIGSPSSSSLNPINQSLVQIRASRVSGESEVLSLPRILPAALNADSEDTVLTGIARKSLAIKDKTGYASEFFFNYARTLKFSSDLTKILGSSK